MLRVFLAIVLLAVAGCHTSAPRTGIRTPITVNAEALAGAHAAPAVEARYGGVIRRPDAERRMARLGRRLIHSAQRLRADYRYRLLDSDAVDAVSLPGGRIYITRALYARLNCDGLVAAVLAHEFAHLEAKDHFKPRTHNPDLALHKELSADTFAAGLLDLAGFRRSSLPDLIALIQTTQPTEWYEARTANLTHSSYHSHNKLNSVAVK